MSAIDFLAKNIQASIKVNDGRYLLETATIDNRLVPHESIVRIIEIVLLYDPEPNPTLTAITLNVDEESILVRAAGSGITSSAEKFLKESHEYILLVQGFRVKMLAQHIQLG